MGSEKLYPGGIKVIGVIWYYYYVDDHNNNYFSLWELKYWFYISHYTLWHSSGARYLRMHVAIILFRSYLAHTHTITLIIINFICLMPMNIFKIKQTNISHSLKMNECRWNEKIVHNITPYLLGVMILQMMTLIF